jgi:hypothetical protein
MRRAAVAAGLFVLIPRLAAGQIVECRGVADQPGFKVLLDEITQLDAAGARVPGDPILMGSVDFAVRSALAPVVAAVRLEVVRCVNRRPRSGTDFDEPLVQRLDDSDALLEVWGSLRPKSGGVPGHDVLLGFLLVPARRDELSSGRPPGVYESITRTESADPLESLLGIFEQSPTLVGYASLALGLRSFRAGRHEEAYGFLCDGVFRLWPPGSTPPADPRQRLLVDHALARAREAATAARRSPDSPLAVLTDEQVDAGCWRQP